MTIQIQRPGTEEATAVATVTGSAVDVASGRDLAE